jgi:hypothetical protein
MRNIPKILIGIAILALAGCVYPDYSYVRGDGGGYYSGDAYYYDGGYAPAYYYDGGYGYYGPSVDIGLGYYGGGYHHGRDEYRDRDRHDRTWRGNSGRDRQDRDRHHDRSDWRHHH